MQAKQQNQVIYRIIKCPQCEKYQRVLKMYIFNRDKFTCQKCHTPQKDLKDGNFLTIHHNIARCNQPDYKIDTIGNCVAWCYKCHQQYNHKNPDQRVAKCAYAGVS